MQEFPDDILELQQLVKNELTQLHSRLNLPLHDIARAELVVCIETYTRAEPMGLRR